MKRHLISDLNDDNSISSFAHNNSYMSQQQQYVNNYTISTDDDDNEDTEEDEIRLWNLEEKLISECYNSQFLNSLDSKNFGIEYFENRGFKYPIVFKKKHGLGLKLPDPDNFSVRDIKNLVGSKRVVDVIDVNTQKGLTMNMKDWCRYFENDRENRLLNVISLEFSHTKLDKLVDVPAFIKKLDWVFTTWPQSLIDSHTESTNLLDKMKYPKVQKYVLMSVAGCYTDFHIDMSGTSVWYHVLKGEKVFWLIPPTDDNLKLYEKWTKSGKQNTQFFADLVSNSQRVLLQQGWTFMLPSGWIHAVYTPKDSIVFGGNFLHNFNIQMQLKIYNIENKIRVPSKFRFPFYLEIIWYVIERHVFRSTGFSYLNEKRNTNDTFGPNQEIMKLTPIEYDGFLSLYNFLKDMPISKRNVPLNINRPDELLKHFKNILSPGLKPGINYHPSTLISTDFDEDTNSANNSYFNQTILNSSTKPVKIRNNYLDSMINTTDMNNNDEFVTKNKHKNEDSLLNSILKSPTKTLIPISSISAPTTEFVARKYNMRKLQRTKGSIKKRLRSSFVLRSNIERRRRIRCRTCEPCVRDDCGDCKYCKDMKKFGGQGISKQCCLKKQCSKPLLPSTTSCMHCKIQINRFDTNTNTMMYECESCFEIFHAHCLWKQYPHLDNKDECIINDTLPSSWHCAKCIKNGFFVQDDKQRQRQQFQDYEDQYYSDDDNDKVIDESENDSSMNYNDSSQLLDSLSYSEKQIILSEFCDIVSDTELDEDSQMYSNQDDSSLKIRYTSSAETLSNTFEDQKNFNITSFINVPSSYNLSATESDENEEGKQPFITRIYDADIDDDDEHIVNEDLLWKPYI